MEQYELLTAGGATLAALAGIGAVIAAAALAVYRKRLNAQLEKEYGPRRPGKQG